MKFEVLTGNKTEYCCKRVMMPEGATRILVNIAEKIRKDQRLFVIYQDFYTKYIQSGLWLTVWEPLAIDPFVEESFGKHASLFYLHAALEKLPFAEKKYQELGIDDHIFVDTLRDIGNHIQLGFDLVGHYCIRSYNWISRHLEAEMFRVGRLQYQPRPFSGDVKGFYNASKDTFLLLCSAGMELCANGDMQGVCEKEATTDGFVTDYQETEDFFIGHPITPYGKALREPVKLCAKSWQKVLEQGDYLCDIHITKEPGFGMEAIIESYQQAQVFFRKHFPQFPIKGMLCHTWLFTPQLQEMLPDTSNIVKFQRQFYLYPTKGSVKFLWNFVFSEIMEQKDAKPDTQLRAKVLKYIEEDKEIFDMRGLFLDISGPFGHVSYMDKYDQRTTLLPD